MDYGTGHDGQKSISHAEHSRFDVPNELKNAGSLLDDCWVIDARRYSRMTSGRAYHSRWRDAGRTLDACWKFL